MLPRFYRLRKDIYKRKRESKRFILICYNCKLEQELFTDQLDKEGFWDCPYCEAENETYGCGLGFTLQDKI